MGMTRHEEVVAAAVAEQARRDRDALGRRLNPDTGVPFPSASQAQLELADDLYARLRAMQDEVGEACTLDDVRDALVEAVVRQHGRTLRACLAEHRAEADRLDEQAATVLDEVAASTVPDADKLAQASRLIGVAWSLRAMHLRGDRA
jgi:hypothetical protein